MKINKLKAFRLFLINIIIILSIFTQIVHSIQSSTKNITSQGIIIYNNGALKWLHTDGRYVKDESGNVVLLRGLALYEAPSETDHMKYNQELSDRVARLKELGINHIRLPIDKADWDANTDTNGDGIGARDFNYQVIDAFTEAGIYVFVGLHYGVNTDEERSWAADPQIMVDWYIDNIIERYKTNPGVNLYIWNEPHYGRWGGDDLSGLTSGYWDAMKYVCEGIYNATTPNTPLMIVHADMVNEGGLSQVLRSDPIPVPNVIYTWHYYYHYGPALNPYNPWLSGIEDPTYEELKSRGFPYYQSYAAGNLSLGKEQFEQSLYDRFLWVPAELNLPIINDEFGFTGNEIPYYSRRACEICLENNGGVVESGVTVWKVSECYADANLTTKMSTPYTGTSYCPNGHEMPQPQPYAEPGWPQVMLDFLESLEKYECSWNYFSWWGYVHGSYGLAADNMRDLNFKGEVWAEHVNSTK